MDPVSTLICCAMALFFSFLFAALLSAAAMTSGPDGYRQATIAGCFVCVLVYLGAVYICLQSQHPLNPIIVWSCVPVGWFFGAWLCSQRVRGQVKELIDVADEAARLGPALFAALDVDGDGVISPSDFSRGWWRAQEQGISTDLLNTLHGNISVFGHDVGDAYNPSWALSADDIKRAPQKAREMFRRWLPHL